MLLLRNWETARYFPLANIHITFFGNKGNFENCSRKHGSTDPPGGLNILLLGVLFTTALLFIQFSFTKIFKLDDLQMKLSSLLQNEFKSRTMFRQHGIRMKKAWSCLYHAQKCY